MSLCRLCSALCFCASCRSVSLGVDYLDQWLSFFPPFFSNVCAFVCGCVFVLLVVHVTMVCVCVSSVVRAGCHLENHVCVYNSGLCWRLCLHLRALCVVLVCLVFKVLRSVDIRVCACLSVSASVQVTSLVVYVSFVSLCPLVWL